MVRTIQTHKKYKLKVIIDKIIKQKLNKRHNFFNVKNLLK